MMRKFNVYIHVFPNGKIYVGQAKDCIRRWSNGAGYKRQKIVYGAILRYGWNNIDHRIVATGLSQEEADEMERRLINYYDSTNRKKGYNVLIGGKTVPNYEHTAEQHRKIGKANMKEVDCYTKSGEYIRSYDCILHAAAAVSGGLKPISSCCHGDKKSAYGYVWRLRGEPFDKYDITPKVGGAHKKPVIVYTADGSMVGEFKSCRSAANYTGVSKSIVTAICKGKQLKSKGYTFRYADITGGTDDE